MTSDNRDHGWHVADSILHRFVDGDVRGQERTAVEALLAGDGDAFARAGDYQRQNVLLQGLHPRRVDDTMLPPAALNLAAALRRGRAVRRAAAACVAGVTLIGAGVAGWQAQSLLRPSAPTPPIVAVFPSAALPSAGATSSARVAPAVPTLPASTSGPLREGAAESQGDSRVPVHPPNLQSVGYQLVDGRADLTAYGPVIRFAYEPTDGTSGTRLALTVAAFGVDRQSLATTINPQHTSLFWQSGAFLFALSGSVEPARLAKVVEAVDVVDRAPPTPAEPAAVPQPAPAVEKPADTPALNVAPPADPANQPKDT